MTNSDPMWGLIFIFFFNMKTMSIYINNNGLYIINPQKSDLTPTRPPNPKQKWAGCTVNPSNSPPITMNEEKCSWPELLKLQKNRERMGSISIHQIRCVCNEIIIPHIYLQNLWIQRKKKKESVLINKCLKL